MTAQLTAPVTPHEITISAYHGDNDIIIERPGGSSVRWVLVTGLMLAFGVGIVVGFACFRGHLVDNRVLGVFVGIAAILIGAGAAALSIYLAERWSGQFGSGALALLGTILLAGGGYWFSQVGHYLPTDPGLRAWIPTVLIIAALSAAVIGGLLCVRYDVRETRRALAWQAAMRRLRQRGRVERGVLSSITLDRPSASGLRGRATFDVTVSSPVVEPGRAAADGRNPARELGLSPVEITQGQTITAHMIAKPNRVPVEGAPVLVYRDPSAPEGEDLLIEIDPAGAVEFDPRGALRTVERPGDPSAQIARPQQSTIRSFKTIRVSQPRPAAGIVQQAVEALAYDLPRPRFDPASIIFLPRPDGYVPPKLRRGSGARPKVWDQDVAKPGFKPQPETRLFFVVALIVFIAGFALNMWLAWHPIPQPEWPTTASFVWWLPFTLGPVLGASGYVVVAALSRWLPGRFNATDGPTTAAIFLGSASMGSVIFGTMFFQMQGADEPYLTPRYYLLPINIALGIGWAAVISWSASIYRRAADRRRRQEQLRTYGQRLDGTLTTIWELGAWVNGDPMFEVEVTLAPVVEGPQSGRLETPGEVITAQMITDDTRVPFPGTAVWVYRAPNGGTGPNDVFIEVNPGGPIDFDPDATRYRMPVDTSGGGGS